MNIITEVLSELENTITTKVKETIEKKVTTIESIDKEDLMKVTTTEILKELKQQFPQYSEAEIKKLVSEFINKIVEHILNKERVVVTGFGTFEPRFQKGREGFNHATGSEFKSKDKYVPKFVASDKFKQLVAEKVK